MEESKGKKSSDSEVSPLLQYAPYSDNTPDIISYECEEVTPEELQRIWDPAQNPAYAK